ncbi:MAG: Gfo/Idh/MocA family oxidoreductase [Pseudomonadota bacterium]
MKQTRVAVIGAGYFGQFHYDSWARMYDCALVAMCVRPGEDASTTAMRYGVEAMYEDPVVMVETTEPDIVDIVAPPVAHHSIIASIAGKVKWIICQKPFCENLDEAREVAELIENSSSRLVIHENIRFQPWYREINRLLQSGAIGTPYQVSFRLRPGDGQGHDAYLDRQPYFQKMPRFLVRETAVHWIDTFRFLFGEVSSISADLHRLNPAIAGEDAGVLQMTFKNGARGLFDGNRLVDHPATNRRLTMGEMLLEGSDGTISLDGDARIARRIKGSTDWVPHAYPWANRNFGGDCVFSTNRAALEALRNDVTVENEVAAYIRNLELVEAAYQSNAERRWIDV